MNRFKKYLATAALLVLPILAACGEDPVVPPATGSIAGQVSIEGMGIDGVSVNLSNGASTTTAGGGTYRFDGVGAGAYTVTISGFPADASFDATSAAATIPENGGSVTLDFRGSYIRTASIMGTVTVENMGLGGVTVRLSGMADAQTATDNNGQFTFTGLRAGTYSVEISGFDMDEVGFGSTSAQRTVGVGETEIITFDGTYLRTAGIMGQVSVEGVGLAGVTVSLAGEESKEAMTDASGQYAFSKLKAGAYTVGISGYNEDDVEFGTTSMNVDLATGETANVPFNGTLLRTAGISGRVSVGGMGLAGVTVSLSGMDDPRETTTNAQGQYGFAGLAEGAYTVAISGYDATEYAFEAERSVTLAQSQSAIENFDGTSLRTAGVAGMVTVEESGVAGVTVTLIQMTGAMSGDVIGIKQTGDDGSYAFGDLLAGIYRVDIAGFDAEYAFETTNWQGQVATGDVADASFAGTIIRTASIGGMVTVEGSGKEGVTVSLAGGTDGVDDTAMTGADGGYMFDGLRRGDYTVTITNPDEALYSFTATERKVSVGVGQAQGDVSFAGTMLRQGSISGRVHAEGTAIVGATVTLAGAMDDTRETDDQGNYAFTGLGPGTYVVSVTNPDEVAYDAPESTSENVTLDSADGKETVNFAFTHTRTASVTGKAFVDEAARDGMYTANEPAFEGMEIPLTLQGPGVNDEMDGMIGMDGSYAFEGLRAGTYRVLVDLTAEVRAGLEEAGYEFLGDVVGDKVTVASGGTGMVNFPFGITMQTITVGARMGYGEHLGVPVAGVELAVYANANMTGMLGEGTTNETGHATIDFARAMNTGPGGNDNLVFVNVSATGHDDLSVSDNDVIEVSYPATARAHEAPAAVKLVNTRANFQFWVKNNADARGGDKGLGGWATEVTMGMDTVPLMVVNAKGDTVNATMPTDTAMASRGRAGLSYVIDPATLKDGPATFTVMVQDDQSSEMYDQSDALVHMHNALAHPDMNTMEMNDLGPIRVTWTTQTLTVGVYREVDDEPGFTDYRAPMGGDQRPDAAVAAEMAVQLLTRDTRNRLRAYEYDHDDKPTTDDISSMAIGKTGMASFPHLPADEEFTVRLHVRSDRMLVGETDSGDMETFGDDLDIGMSTGSFGEASGAGPEVKLCSVSTDAKKCATWGYQWTTGSVSGSVAGPGGASVSLAAETDADDRVTKTGADSKKASFRKFSISDIQDGEYTLTTPNTGDNKFGPKGGHELEIYHDEDEDDEDDDTEYVGTAWSMTTANFTATNLRQSIKGFVANDGGDGRARGNEAMSDVEVNLLAIAKDGVSKNKKDTTFTTEATVTTNEDGFYEFNNLAAGGKYFVEVPAGDDYMGLRDIEDGLNNKSAEVRPDEYPAMKEPFGLPSWNHMTNEAENATPTVKARAPSTVSAKLQNFALVYTDNNVSGSVTNLSGSDDGDITVELAHCEAYSTSDGCEWGNIVKMETNSKGSYEFSDLMEGYYEVWFTGGGLAAANVDDKGKPDDDGDTSGATSHTASVMGRDDYSTGNNFIIYSKRAGTADILTSLVVMEVDADGEETDHADGVAIPSQSSDGQDAVDLGGPEIDWASLGVAIETKRSSGASVSVGLTKAVSGHSASDLPFNVTGSGENQSLATEITVTVTAANGYNDHDYSFSVSRANPVGNSLAAGDFDVEDPADARVAHAFGRVDRFTVNVAEAATDMTFTVTLEDIDKQDLVVELGGKEQDPASREDDDDDNELRYEVELSTGANTIDMMVTSEDGEDREHQLVVRRDARSDDATLSALSLSAGTLSPAFNAGTTSYAASVGNAVTSVTVTATANDADASVAYSPGRTVNLDVGANPITVTVTAEDGTTGDYTVKVTRDAPGVSSDATLGALSLSDGATLSPAFARPC